ncbi:Hypoxic response protein 1 [Candidatus Brocadiaceae bacterium B188]|jgi:CBS domain-containing protein|nr:CBS domain-containing protein [Candidatus Brocadia sapporoensis]MEB2308307.1 CBS domain-containing protein [Candidatus Brocadiaceae bacterium]OQZ03996.1 MAG: histidine kinase [Candidatus Brocadia sp. UTAMX1]QQR66866.1 MAG: CBS domain-containing protein [Candidatus Brocadia sp.]RZV57857.1 MAG: CBS domain-containing protein [Candidatus Brocadia sp. BROELEC01]TWU53846.1 Hypoxic response protein 1 [Candidatus Brocadiaceae bacterium B188]
MAKNDIVAKDIMNKNVTVARKEALGRSLAEKLLTGKYSGMPVVDDNNKIIGVISEFDLLKVMDRGKSLEKVTAEEIMSAKPIFVAEDTPVEDIIHIMTKHNIIRVPVVRDGIPVGIISRCDIIRCVYGVLSPEFVRINSEREKIEFFTEFKNIEFKSSEELS